MSHFIHGFEKTSGFAESAGKVLNKAKEVGKGFLSGGSQAMKAPLGSHLNPANAYRTVSNAAKKNGGFIDSFKSVKGRKAMGEAMGKAAPGAVAAGGYAYGAKKVYDKTLGAPSGNADQYSSYAGY